MNQAMSSPKLILLEGIPGSGKSSAGEFVQGLLQRQGLAVRFWREGDFDHPADFEGVAGLSEGYYRELLARFSHLAALIQQHTAMRGADFLVSYRKLQYTPPRPYLQRWLKN
jgi:adenylylsulfate kinase-like enzyme